MDSVVMYRSTVKDSFLERAMQMCQDTDSDVRLCMAHQLRFIGKGVGFVPRCLVALPFCV